MRLGVGIGMLCVCGAALLAAGCGGGGGQTELRVLNASPNEGAINVLVDSNTVASSIGYATATDYISVKSGSRHLQIEPATSTTVAIDTSLNLASSTQTTVIAANFAANISPIILTDSTTASTTSGDAQIRVVNAAPSIGTVDVYIVTPGTDLTTTTPVASSVAFQSSSGYTSEVAGTWEIFFTVPGTTFALLDTGPISFTSGQNRTVVALNGAAGGYSYISLADLN